MPLLGQGREDIRVGPARVVIRLLRRVEAFGVEVGDLHAVAEVPQGLQRDILERGVERLRLRMAVDDQGLHGGSPFGSGLLIPMRLFGALWHMLRDAGFTGSSA